MLLLTGHSRHLCIFHLSSLPLASPPSTPQIHSTCRPVPATVFHSTIHMPVLTVHHACTHSLQHVLQIPFYLHGGFPAFHHVFPIASRSTIASHPPVMLYYTVPHHTMHHTTPYHTTHHTLPLAWALSMPYASYYLCHIQASIGAYTIRHSGRCILLGAQLERGSKESLLEKSKHLHKSMV